MARSITPIRSVRACEPMADRGSPSREAALEARIARLEAEAVYIKRDLAEIKSVLRGIAQRVDEVRGFMKAKWPKFENIDRFPPADRS